MATTASVVSEDAVANGRRRVRYRYDTGTGKQWDITPFVQAVVVAQVDADSRIPQQDLIQRESEREQAYAIAIDGGDPDLETWHLNTLAEIQKYVYRRLFNLMRDEVNDPEKAIVCGSVQFYLNKHNSPTIAGFIDDPAWSTPTVNGASGKIAAVGVNIVQLDHGEAELALDF